MSRLASEATVSLRIDRRAPARLAALHWELPVGARVHVTVAGVAKDAPDARTLLIGAGFVPARAATRWTLTATRALSLPDTVAAGMRVLVCGLNPSIYAAEHGVGFARPNNRFWRAAADSSLVSHPRDPLRTLRIDRVGMTDLCKRATVGSAEVTPAEYVDGARRVERLVRWLQPRVVAFVGLEGWRAAIDRHARAGLQPLRFGGRSAYVLPSTSGLNARTRLDDLVTHLTAVRHLAAGG